MRSLSVLLSGVFLSASVASLGQAAATRVDHYSSADLIGRARQEGGTQPLFSAIMERYPNHYSMLVHRRADGQSELHERYADVMVILDGEGQLVTGGTMQDGKQTAPGERRGAGISGGSSMPIKRGDILHIPANLPHQVRLPSGGEISYFVLKVDETAVPATGAAKP